MNPITLQKLFAAGAAMASLTAQRQAERERETVEALCGPWGRPAGDPARRYGEKRAA